MKKILVAFTIILVMILSTGCKAENSKENQTLPVLTLNAEVIEPESTLPVETTNSSIYTTTESTEKETTLAVKETLPTVEETTSAAATIPHSEETTTEYSEETTTTEEIISYYTYTDLPGKIMYVIQEVNVRNLPSIEGDIIASLGINHEVWITGQCNETGWYRIDIEGYPFYLNNYYVSDNRYIEPTTVAISTTQAQRTSQGFIYYTVAGQRPNYDYERYLYNCLADRGIAWWYPWAVAQIWQESRWNPNSTNGRDHGICQFKGETFSARAAHHAGYPDADIWNPYDSLYVYSFYIRDVLAAVGWDIDAALAFYITGTFGMRHDTYVNYVHEWYNALGAE